VVNPSFTERLAKEHRDDLLRAAEASRSVHSTEFEASQRWWSLPLRFRFGRRCGSAPARVVASAGQLSNADPAVPRICHFQYRTAHTDTDSCATGLGSGGNP
jgi:hypothetical protein